MSELTFAATRFMGSLHSFCARIGTMNLRKVRAARQRAADVSSAEPSFFCRQDAGSTLRFMESLDARGRRAKPLSSYQFERFEVEPDVPAKRPEFADQLDVRLILLNVEIKSHQDPVRVSGNFLAELMTGNP